MTRNRTIFVGVVGLLLIVAILWRLSAGNREKSGPSATAFTSPVAPQPAASPAAPAPVAAATPPGKPKREVMREVLSTLNHQPIEFYGKIVDQSGEPIPDVKVTGSVIYNSGIAAGVDVRQTTTDRRGLFSFRGMQGRSFDYHLEKSGYESMPEGDAFDYTKLISEDKRHHPDPNNPVVLKMWRLQGAEPLIYKQEIFKLPSDGTPVRIDLEAGKIVRDGGNLILMIKHGMQPAGTSITRYDWNAEITAVDGGLIEAEQRVTNMHLAPEEGYVPSIAVEMPATRHDWSRTYTRNLYLKSRGGRYARLSFDLHTVPTGTSYVVIKSWANPSGSRNLEYDSSKQASAH